MNDITMGGNHRNAINLDDVVQENDEDDNTKDIAEADDIKPTIVQPLNNNLTATSSPHRKSNIKVTYEDAEPVGLKQPTATTLTKTVTTAVTAVTKSVTGSISDLQQKYAYMLGVFPEALQNLCLYQFIEEWYGVRYHFGGCDKNGIDCSAFVQKVYEHVFGTNLLRTAIEQFASSDFIKKATSLHEGDLVFFKIHSHRITHVGIYLANNFFIHASRSQGVTISNLNDSYWRKYYAGAGKLGKS